MLLITLIPLQAANRRRIPLCLRGQNLPSPFCLKRWQLRRFALRVLACRLQDRKDDRENRSSACLCLELIGSTDVVDGHQSWCIGYSPSQSPLPSLFKHRTIESVRSSCDCWQTRFRTISYPHFSPHLMPSIHLLLLSTPLLLSIYR